MPTYINTRDILGEQGTLDALVDHSLTSFTDDAVKKLRSNAFYFQSQIEEICLPNLMSLSGNNVFDKCYKLHKLKIALNVQSVIPLSNLSLFNPCDRVIIYVPDDLVSNYKAAQNWKNNSIVWRIHGISEDGGAHEWSDTEISDTWEQIAAKISAGTAADSYKYGQYKDIDLGSEGNIRFQIVAKNADELADGTGTAQLTWVAVSALATSRRFNPALVSGTSGTGMIGGWKESELRSVCNNTLLPLFPQNVRNCMKSVKKYSTIYDTNGTKVTDDLTNDILWIPSAREFFGNYETLGPIYDFAFGTDYFRIKNQYGTNQATNFALRTAQDTSDFRGVHAMGYGTYYTEHFATPIVPGFCT